MQYGLGMSNQQSRGKAGLCTKCSQKFILMRIRIRNHITSFSAPGQTSYSEVEHEVRLNSSGWGKKKTHAKVKSLLRGYKARKKGKVGITPGDQYLLEVQNIKWTSGRSNKYPALILKWPCNKSRETGFSHNNSHRECHIARQWNQILETES